MRDPDNNIDGGSRSVAQNVLLAFMLCCELALLSPPSFAQDAPGPPVNHEEVALDLSNLKGTRLPFNVKTFWRGKIPPGVGRVELRFQEDHCRGIELLKPDLWDKQQALAPVTHFAIPVVQMFRPWQLYCVAITTCAPSKDAKVDSSKVFKVVADPQSRDLRGLTVREYQSTPRIPASRQTLPLMLTPEPSLQNYLSTSIDLAYAPGAKTWIGTSFLHVHLAAVNKNTDLHDFSGSRLLWQRISLFAGVAPVKIYSNADVSIENVSAVGNFVTGIAIRSPLYPEVFTGGRARVFLQPLSINVGVLRYAQNHANPLIDDHVVKSSMVVGITYDVAIKALIAPIVKLFS